MNKFSGLEKKLDSNGAIGFDQETILLKEQTTIQDTTRQWPIGTS